MSPPTSTSSDCINTDSPDANVLHPLSMHSSLEQVSARSNDIDNAELGLGIPSNIPTTLPNPPFVDASELHHPPSLIRMRTASRPPNSIGLEALAIMAGVVLTIQFNMLTAGSMATTTSTRALLFFGMTFELLAILLTITFIQALHRPSLLLRFASGMSIVLVLMGIVGLAVALVVEMLKTSLSMAVVMSGFIIFGIILCLLTSFFGSY